MSLHRVNSFSSYEQIRGGPSDQPEPQKVSFDPVPSWEGRVGKEEPVGAYEVSKFRRIVQVGVAVIYCLFSAGVVFGYAALKPVLISEGVYGQYCTEEEEASLASRTCDEQEIRLNLMFTTAAVATNVCALPVGTVLDRFGPRVSGIVGSVLLTIGALLLAFATRLTFDAYIPGYLFLALGGPFVFISSFQLSNTFPKHSGLILALLTGAFDSSSAIFLFYRLIYTASNDTFGPDKFFLAYLVVPVFILVVQIFVMPGNSYKTVGEMIKHAEESDGFAGMNAENAENEHHRQQLEEEAQQRRESIADEMTSLLGKSGDKQQQQEEQKKQISGVWGILHGYSALEQIKTPWFILITLFTVVQMTRINYFVATIFTQYEYIFKSARSARTINHFFDAALPLGGIVSIPFIGLILDNTSTTFTLSLLVFAAALIGLLGMLPFMWAAYANVVIFTLYRPLYYTAVSDYAAKVFGFQTFGKVYGLIICLAGVLNFAQSALDALTHKGFNGDPLPINLVLEILALLVGAILVWYVWYKSRRYERKELEEEAEQTTETPMPGAQT